jgi:hypothetical protein
MLARDFTEVVERANRSDFTDSEECCLVGYGKFDTSAIRIPHLYEHQ